MGVARVDGVAAASRRRCSAAAPAYGAGGASTVSFGVLAPRVANSKRAARLPWRRFPGFCWTLSSHLSDGMSITLNVGAGVASAGASAASARKTARGARTAHCGAIRPAAPVKARASTIRCISKGVLGWFVAANTVVQLSRALKDVSGFAEFFEFKNFVPTRTASYREGLPKDVGPLYI